MAETGIALGIDVGGSGIKGAPVDLDRGDFAADRIRIETPEGPPPRLSARSSPTSWSVSTGPTAMPPSG